ncbi:hypothetical protein BJ508DRAFT_343525 [Ascobolus immersus RN42]|uniref:Uncharacterized protein n=1 Tax=Ascobolus immersus RN42 TaxID=1160509 RepID=A0A3N4HCZ5_ASCIM|nr:hypothetical protein BJ508DRAFT_343525 [Ascobolus immersus RN42]
MSGSRANKRRQRMLSSTQPIFTIENAANKANTYFAVFETSTTNVSNAVNALTAAVDAEIAAKNAHAALLRRRVLFYKRENRKAESFKKRARGAFARGGMEALGRRLLKKPPAFFFTKKKRNAMLELTELLAELVKKTGLKEDDIKTVFGDDHFKSMHKEVHQLNLDDAKEIKYVHEAMAKSANSAILVRLLYKLTEDNVYWSCTEKKEGDFPVFETPVLEEPDLSLIVESINKTRIERLNAAERTKNTLERLNADKQNFRGALRQILLACTPASQDTVVPGLGPGSQQATVSDGGVVETEETPEEEEGEENQAEEEGQDVHEEDETAVVQILGHRAWCDELETWRVGYPFRTIDIARRLRFGDVRDDTISFGI